MPAPEQILERCVPLNPSIMSYSLSIVRMNNWEDDEEKSNITLEEWLHYIDSDEELESPGESSFTDDNREFYRNIQGYCEWTGHSTFKEPFARPWFEYNQGQLPQKGWMTKP